MIPFNKPCYLGKESYYIQESIVQNEKISGNGPFGIKCKNWLEEQLTTKKALLTPSCTAALEMTALLADISEGDEVIMPSYTFVSTANAFALRGASLRFVDIEPGTMNIDPEKIEAAISNRTKALVIVHYAGVACNMEQIIELAERYSLLVIEDAAQALMSTYQGKPLGTFGHFGTISFHETKNYTCGEGGALLINDESYAERAEVIQEKGTDRSKFNRGQVDKYTWQDLGSSYLLSELNAAYLFAQLESAEEILADRLHTWQRYKQKLAPLEAAEQIETQQIPEYAKHNAHMFYIKASSPEDRMQLMTYLKEREILAVPHYEPLHSSKAGRSFGRLSGEDTFTTREGERLLRLPLYYGMNTEDVDYVAASIQNYYQS